MRNKINLIEASLKHRQIIIVFALFMMSIGVVSLITMPRNEFPDFTIRQGLIIGIYPGATSLQVEEQVTKVVENYLFGYEEVNKVKTKSDSREGMMIIYVELNDEISDSDKFWSELRLGLQELKNSLPGGLLALMGTNNFGDSSALLITMSSETMSYRQLETVMKELEDEVRKLESVSKIKRYGEQKENIYVYIRPEKLNEYRVNSSTILASFKLQDMLNYAGDLDNGKLIMPIHLPPRFESLEDLEQQIVYSDPLGNVIRLKDIARAERKYEEPDNYLRNNGKNALLLSLEMQRGNNIVQFGKDVRGIFDKFRAKHSEDVEINIISDQPAVVDNSISHFLHEFIIAILSVIIVTMILLPFRIATVAGVTIPISILITLAIMQALGFQLDIVSLAGLIVVLGMVVDNSIVVIDNHVEKLDNGLTPWKAAWQAATELFIPVLSATAAICAAFFPLMIFLNGMSRDFVGSFPLTIGIALGVSLIVAALLVPVMCYAFIKTGLHNKKSKNKRKSILDIVQKYYDTALLWTFKYPKFIILTGILSVIIAVILFTNVDQKLFPAMDRMQFAVEVYLPEGAPLCETEIVIDSLEQILMKDKRVTNVASFIGTSSPRFNALYAPHLPAKNYGQILANTVSNEKTVELLDEYERKYKGMFPNAKVKWKQIAMENFTAPIEVRLSGDNIIDLKKSAKMVGEILKNNSGVIWVRNDWLELRRGLSVSINRDKANRMGYTKTFVATSLMTSLKGLPLTTIWEGDYPVEVILSNEEEEKDELSDLENQYVVSPLTMESLPLRSIANIEPEWTEGAICRRNGVRTITVQADVSRGALYSNVFNQVKPAIDGLELPDGIELEYGGESESAKENYVKMGYALGTSVLLIFFILMLQFKTVRRALLVMSTMLLSLFGISVGLIVIGYPFGMTSFIGVIGLMGITVRNGIILIDYAMQLVNNEGYSFKDAAIAAGKRRMRPIFLTSMAAAIGVVPMILSDSPLWGPLGTVVCFGLIFGMLLTLLILPVLYWISSGTKDAKKQKLIIDNKEMNK